MLNGVMAATILLITYLLLPADHTIAPGMEVPGRSASPSSW